MSYFPNTERAYFDFRNWLMLLRERGGDTAGYEERLQTLLLSLRDKLVKEVERAPVMENEPSDLDSIHALRPRGPRKLVDEIPLGVLTDKLMGAGLGRAAGCILGGPCEGFTKNKIRNAAESLGMRYPLKSYWTLDPGFHGNDVKKYGFTPMKKFLNGHITYVGVDDDLTYTLLGLLILEDYGPSFTTAQVGEAWIKYLPMAFTAEKVALNNLRKGIDADRCGVKDNPFADWIGAYIRSDSWGYAAAGWPEKAAELAHCDAYISHRATGIHGEMFFSAAIAAAFVVDDPIEAIRIGLTEIPKSSRTTRTVKEALRWCEKDGDWDKTTDRILKKYEGMGGAHTLNNAALTVAGIFYGDKNFEKVITLTVMGGVDTDCTGATAGSLIGAILGAKRLPKKWIEPLGTRAESYINGHRWWNHKQIVKRFQRVGEKVRNHV
jgi:ADP-ribosylglycohydrolase